MSSRCDVGDLTDRTRESKMCKSVGVEEDAESSERREEGSTELMSTGNP